MNCKCCGGELCGVERTIFGNFVKRDGKTSNSYKEYCAFVLEHSGPHSFETGNESDKS